MPVSAGSQGQSKPDIDLFELGFGRLLLGDVGLDAIQPDPLAGPSRARPRRRDPAPRPSDRPCAST